MSIASPAVRRRDGFTIVELLIVIVVIGILAAITIVAYNGIQQRATNGKMVSAVRAYYSALATLAADKGAIPNSQDCLGAPAVYVSNPCYTSTTDREYTGVVATAVAPYLPNIPDVPKTRIAQGTTLSASGIFYYPSGNYIGFAILGSSTCPDIAGATPQADVQFGSDVYCRINRPSV